jgi:methyltransferase (TIGR00027 family)
MSTADITDTARWFALYRAQESERPDALFHDPLARRLAGEPNDNVVQLMRRGHGMDWSMSVRTAVIDEMILGAVRTHSIDTVLMLGAGLDTRPYRLPFPQTLTWHEVDLPVLVAEKERLLAEEPAACRVVREGVDLLDVESS